MSAGFFLRNRTTVAMITRGTQGLISMAGLVAYMLSPESGVMTGVLVDYDQNVAGAYPE
jgi:hypothetical protein